MDNGMLIVFEGASDGIGKSTQLKMLRNRLESEGNIIVDHHFPSYGTYHGALVEKYLSGDFGKIEDLSPYFVNSLFALDRACVWNTKLKPLYDEGKIILLDRYTTSSLIYQSAKIEDYENEVDFLDFVSDFEYNKLGIQKPDIVIFLTAPFNVITQMRNRRVQNDGISNDLHERDNNYLREVYNNANYVAHYFSWDRINCCDSNNNLRSKEDIHEEIYNLVKEKSKKIVKKRTL